jgi:hypothetical protein
VIDRAKPAVKMRTTQRPIRARNVARRRHRQAKMHLDHPKQVFMGDAFETFHERYQQERSMAYQAQQKQKNIQPKKTCMVDA